MADAAVAALQAGREPSAIADHGADCCALARTWLACLDSSLHRARVRAAPPAWIAQRWARGESGGALHWCEVAVARALGPEASAALARALWGRRAEGIRAVQLVELRVAGVGEHAANARGGERAGGEGELAYREAVGRELAGRLEIWDPTGCAWLGQRPAGASGHVLSLRVSDSETALLRWGEHRLTAGSWTTLGMAQA